MIPAGTFLNWLNQPVNVPANGAFYLHALGGEGGDYNGWAYFTKNLNIGTNAGRKVRVNYYWTGYDSLTMTTSGYAYIEVSAFKIGSNTIIEESGGINAPTQWVEFGHDWATKEGSIPDSLTGNQQIQLYAHVYGDAFTGSEPYDSGNNQVLLNSLLVYASDLITVTGLAPGQKVEVYQTIGNTLISSAVGGASSVGLDVSGVATLPTEMYLKIYNVDGSSLIETTQAYVMCGGDVWLWNPTLPLIMNVDNFIIYQQSSLGIPKTATVTAELFDQNKNSYAGATIYFKTSRGNLSAASAVTDVRASR
ncbi:MAG: Ig-like domain-containing protein [Candidatus Bathyarchaeia archaeon]